MTLDDILDRLDRRVYSDGGAGQDFMRGALIGLIKGCQNEGHDDLPGQTCFICQALEEMVAVANILDRS